MYLKNRFFELGSSDDYKKIKTTLFCVVMFASFYQGQGQALLTADAEKKTTSLAAVQPIQKPPYMVPKKDTEKRERTELSELAFYVLRQKGTEAPHTGRYNLHFEKGVYHCKGCASPLFDSEAKFASHCGWPSFDQAKNNRIRTLRDTSHGMIRTEVVCAQCEGHLGHVFEDGPTETGLRYCINSASLSFEK
jgi:peptide-methionine (R)-S-oxide reductase